MCDESQYLAIDIGNKRGKAALFHGTRITHAFQFPTNDPTPFLVALQSISIEIPVVMTAVGHPGEELMKVLNGYKSLLQVSGTSETPLKMDYATPQSLGPDRLAAAVGAWDAFPEEDILIIDAGTCITADIVCKEGRYLGGSISPGIQMRLEAMHQFTARLPLIQGDEDVELLGTDTKSSLSSGAWLGVVTELEGRIFRLKQQFPGLRVLITGGDAFYLCKKINCNIFVMPDLVFQGLRAILLHHESIKK